MANYAAFSSKDTLCPSPTTRRSTATSRALATRTRRSAVTGSMPPSSSASTSSAGHPQTFPESGLAEAQGRTAIVDKLPQIKGQPNLLPLRHDLRGLAVALGRLASRASLQREWFTVPP